MQLYGLRQLLLRHYHHAPWERGMPAAGTWSKPNILLCYSTRHCWKYMVLNILKKYVFDNTCFAFMGIYFFWAIFWPLGINFAKNLMEVSCMLQIWLMISFSNSSIITLCDKLMITYIKFSRLIYVWSHSTMLHTPILVDRLLPLAVLKWCTQISLLPFLHPYLWCSDY